MRMSMHRGHLVVAGVIRCSCAKPVFILHTVNPHVAPHTLHSRDTVNFIFTQKVLGFGKSLQQALL